MEVVDSRIEQHVAGSMAASSRASKRIAMFTLLGLSAVFLASVLFKPPAGDYFTICGFKNFTGLPCPGCGLTHSFCALGKGDVVSAAWFNLLGPVVFLVMMVIWTRAACVLADRTRIVESLDRIAERFNWVRSLAYAFAVYGLVRIAYIIVVNPVGFRDSPLSQLFARLTH